MAPEVPPKLVILDLAQDAAGALIGKLEYIEPRNDDQLRVRWAIDSQPEGFQAVGGGVAYVFSRVPFDTIPIKMMLDRSHWVMHATDGKKGYPQGSLGLCSF